MKHANKHRLIKRKKVPNPRMDYRPRLESLAAYSLVNPLTPIDIIQLTKDIPLSAQADYFEEIYAIIPVNFPTWGISCVLYRETILLVEQSAQQIAFNLLEAVEHLDYQIYKKTLNYLFNAELRMTPIATRNFSLFPTGGITLETTMWINPGRIETIFTQKKQSIVCLENLFTILIDRHERAIKKRMCQAFWAHAILKREHDNQGTKSTTSLLEFLNITSSTETRDLLKNREFQHIPSYKNDFFKYYPMFNNKKIKADAIKAYCNKYDFEE